MRFLKIKFRVRRFIRERIHYVILLIVLSLYITVAVLACDHLYDDNGPSFNDAVAKYGYVVTLLLCLCLSTTAYISVPSTVLNIIGLIAYNPFKRQFSQRKMTAESPFICFRVVTRGLFPQLVSDITDTNLETCRKVGLQNFKFEIVTDTSLNIKTSNCVREVVVPTNYQTSNGTLFKARALHYCLSTNINILSKDDWIVHLDEETLLTEGVLYGIVDFITKPDSNIGQGVITYAGCGIENWITTLLDGVRVVIDYGLFRFGLKVLKRPVFGFKGSFVVVKMGIEQQVGFDFGPSECIAEDLRFALTAWTQGFKFDFIHGIMKEKSPFSISDYIKQRKRWFIGHFHIVWSNTLPLYSKLFILPMNIVNILLWTNLANVIIPSACTVPILKGQLLIFSLLTANILFMLAYGNFMSLCHKRYSLVQRIILCFIAQLLVPLLMIVESWAVIQGIRDRNKLAFDIVKKDTVAKPFNTATRDCIV